jgi:nucleotide-binding universal stress UspA family protein
MSNRVPATKVFSSEREIVVGVDGSRYSKDAVTWAVHEAKLREAVLRPVCVAPIGSDLDFDWTVGDSLAESQKMVDQAVEAAEAIDPTVVVRGEVLVGPVAETLMAASEVTDLLVVGARGAGTLSEILLGSVSRACAREARCPVVIVHELAQPAIAGSTSRIVVEVGEGRDSDALHWAIEEAALRSALVEGVRFTSSGTQHLAGGGLFASRARRVSTVDALLEACHGADLLVLPEVALEGTHEQGVGSLLRRCVHLAPCPVVVVGPSTSRVEATDPGRCDSDA